jgi:hypothetical protein
MTAAFTDSRLAMPGDPDLDMHLTGVRIGSVVVMRGTEWDAEVTLTFATDGASGWWRDTADGEVVYPDSVTTLEAVFGLRMDAGHELLLEWLIGRLESWREEGCALTMTSAPGKWTGLAPSERPGELAAIPRTDALWEASSS